MIFALMYTLGDQRGTLGCFGDDLPAEADEVDLEAVEAHLMKLLVVKRCRHGSVERSPGEAGFLKELLLVKWEAIRCEVGSAACRMLLPLFRSHDGATSARRQTLLSTKGTGSTL